MSADWLHVAGVASRVEYEAWAEFVGYTRGVEHLDDLKDLQKCNSAQRTINIFWLEHLSRQSLLPPNMAGH
jgi:hypothetical protein